MSKLHRANAIVTADYHLTEAGLPTYSRILCALKDLVDALDEAHLPMTALLRARDAAELLEKTDVK